MISDFGSDKIVKKVRKDYDCKHCSRKISAGTSAITTAGKHGGEFFSFRSHPDCRDLWLTLANSQAADDLDYIPSNNLCVIRELEADEEAIAKTHPIAFARLKNG